MRHSAQFSAARVIAVARTLLATFFLLAVVALGSGNQERTSTVVLLSAYVFWSVTLLATVWKNWWLDRRLGGAAHAIDLGAFGVLILLAQAEASPFLTFAVFLVLSSLTRWGWRSAALNAIIIALLFLIIGLHISGTASPFVDAQPFALVACANLIVVSALIMWFGAHKRRFNATEFLEGLSMKGAGDEPARPLENVILDAAAKAFSAENVVLVWWETEEPWTNVSASRGGQVETRRLRLTASSLLPPELSSAGAFLFDNRKHRVITQRGGLRALHHLSPIEPSFASTFNIVRGIRLPVRAEGYGGEVFVLDPPFASADDIEKGAQVSLMLSELYYRSAVLGKTKDAAAARERLAVAQDLHDSVIQFLAGTSLKLEGLRKAALKQKAINEDMLALQQELKHEQRDLRNFIVTLRGAGGPPRNTDIAKHLGYLADRLSSQWSVDCKLEYRCPVMGPNTIQQDLESLVRETVSNAVRHGGATKLRAHIFEEADGVRLEIQDNGKGFPHKGEFSDEELRRRKIGPWSLHERVSQRGGKLHLNSTEHGARLRMHLPTESNHAAHSAC